jgi:hypothetical protein
MDIELYVEYLLRAIGESKVEASIPVKISNCSYFETRLYRESKIEKKHKTYFFEIFLY